MKRLAVIFVLSVLSGTGFADDRLIGVWKSSLKLTKKYNDEHAKMTDDQAKFLYQIVGDLKLTYQADTFVAESVVKNVTVKGKTYPWGGETETYKYKVLGADDKSVVIQQFGGHISGSITTLHFETSDIYWEYLGSSSNINGREYFVRVK
jgi:hypothetical protein